MPESDAELSEKERTMARQLVESLAVEGFDPQKYHDQYREQLLDLIARKESGADIVAEPQTEPPAKVLDLVAALEASIAKSKTAKDRHPTGAATSRAARESGRHQGHEGDRQGDKGTGQEGRPRQEERLTVRSSGAPKRRLRRESAHGRAVLCGQPAAVGTHVGTGRGRGEPVAGLPPAQDRGLVVGERKGEEMSVSFMPAPSHAGETPTSTPMRRRPTSLCGRGTHRTPCGRGYDGGRPSVAASAAILTRGSVSARRWWSAAMLADGPIAYRPRTA